MGFSMKLVSAVSILANVVAASPLGPCDLYKKGGTPCVAAHSTTRALYRNYKGPLYQVMRGSDNTFMGVYPLKAGGVANAASQDAFCMNTTCLIYAIYDQSGMGNTLTQAPPGGFNGPLLNGYDYLTSAIGAPVTVFGKKAYGVFTYPGSGYRIDNTNGVARGNDPEGIYAVMDATHYNGGCCYDYGNAEANNHDNGNAHMEAVYLGNIGGYGNGTGPGPWTMADLENGVFSTSFLGENPNDPTVTYPFITNIVKGNSSNLWAIKNGNAQKGNLNTVFEGPRPDSYYPMQKEGSIILGIGGDNSNGAQGTFYEGAMTMGYPTDATENAVQANIVNANYQQASYLTGVGPGFQVGDTVNFLVTTPGFNTRYIVHNGTLVETYVVTNESSQALINSALWTVTTGLGFAGCYSFESVDTPGSYLRHYDYQLMLNQYNPGDIQFTWDATFCPQVAMNNLGTNSVRSWSYPTRYWRHYGGILYIADNGGMYGNNDPLNFDNSYSFGNDVSFIVSNYTFLAPSS